jgi:hypothetical protein
VILFCSGESYVGHTACLSAHTGPDNKDSCIIRGTSRDMAP